jgi:hypothetical protein
MKTGSNQQPGFTCFGVQALFQRNRAFARILRLVVKVYAAGIDSCAQQQRSSNLVFMPPTVDKLRIRVMLGQLQKGC